AAIAAVYLVLRYLEDYLVIPYVLGRAVDVHPLILIFAVIVGAELFGLGGAMLAAPLAGVLRVLAGWLSRKLLRPVAPRPLSRLRLAYRPVYPQAGPTRARLRRGRTRPGPAKAPGPRGATRRG